MTDVIIAGIGQTTVGEHWDIGLRDLAFAAIQAAVKDAGGRSHREYWIPAEDLPAFNAAIVGPIVVIAEFRGEGDSGRS